MLKMTERQAHLIMFCICVTLQAMKKGIVKDGPDYSSIEIEEVKELLTGD